MAAQLLVHNIERFEVCSQLLPHLAALRTRRKNCDPISKPSRAYLALHNGIHPQKSA
jgi:hypothetical protein